MLPGETAESIFAQCQELLERELPDVDVLMLPPELSDEAMETPADSAVVQTASRILSSVGLDSEPGGVSFGCDCTKLSRAGIPSIIFGPGSIEQAHTDDEFIEIDQVHTAVDFYRQFLLKFE
jgi:acetylornithine deacetylase